MRKVRCVKGHFYDVDASTLCPHCGSQEAKEEMTTTDIEDSAVSDGGKKRFSIFGKGKSEKEKLYLRLMLVTDYVCGMTDSFAKDLYQELNGIV